MILIDVVFSFLFYFFGVIKELYCMRLTVMHFSRLSGSLFLALYSGQLGPCDSIQSPALVGLFVDQNCNLFNL